MTNPLRRDGSLPRRLPMESSRPSRWQLTVSGTLLLMWILVLAWIAFTG
jgi:hypothetical protein